MSDDEVILEESIGFMQEPEDFYPPEKEPTFELYERKTGKEPSKINIRLVGKHPLWGHLLWNAGKVMADYLDEKVQITDKTVLELGAGGALPSIVCFHNKAEKVIVTDYPDADLIENISFNVNLNAQTAIESGKVIAMGHLWGKDVPELLKKITVDEKNPRKFDIIILSDLIFNHSCHFDLLKTSKEALSKDGKVYVSFSHHRPKFMEKDMVFFKMAAEEPFNFQVEHQFSLKLKPMFEVDEGPEDIRATVHFYILSNK